MLKNVIAVVVGMVAGMIANMVFILINLSLLYPAPEGMDTNDPEQFTAYLESLPPAGFIMPMIAHTAQAAVGGWVAARMSATRPMLMAWIVGVLTLVGSVIMLVDYPGPPWMWTELLLIVLVTRFVGNLESKRRLAQAE